jgi:predicted RNA-binding protein associated with RNAse of E/G family
MQPGETLRVIKRNAAGQPVWEYAGVLDSFDGVTLCLVAFFDVSDRDDGYFVWQRGDRFVEFYYTDRWYNVFQIFDRTSGALRGWYCNLTRPAVIEAGLVAWDDLGLDVFVYPDGRLLLLDEDDFRALPLTPSERAAAEAGLAQLQAAAQAGAEPFVRNSPR